MAKEIKQKELKKRMKEKSLKFVGFITEQQIKNLKKDYVFFRTKNKNDLIGELSGIGNRNIYLYKEVKK